MGEQVGNSSGSVSTGYIAPVGAASGSSSSVPSWFNSMDWGQFSGLIASGLGSSLGGSIGAAVGGATGNDNLAGVLGMAGSAIGGKVASNLMSGLKAFSGFNTNSLTNIGGSIAGSLVSNMIGGDAGRAAGVALGNAGNIVKGVKSISQTSKGIKAAKLAKDANALKGLKAALLGNVANIAGIGASIASEFMPEKTEYSGDKGGLARDLDTAYDIASTAVSFIPGVGTVIRGAMQVRKLLGLGLNALGGGTDGMTTADAILGSSFMNLTPLGMINGFGGKRAHTIERDDLAFQVVGSSYAGTQDKVDDAVTKSGKKYGLVSSGSRRSANRLIDRAKLEQSRMSGIADEAAVDRLMASTLSQENYINVQNQLSGQDFYGIRAGKKGMTITKEKIAKAKRVRKLQEEARMEEVAGFKQGGVLDLSWEEEPITFSYKESWNPGEWEEELIITYKVGGKLEESSSEETQSKNVIPEGALHARLHHMDLEGITKKGIPVITEEDGGVVQHAEIERNEIIFRLEVTKKLEQLAKDGSNEAAIEAGKLLVKEILENTEDNTGLINEID